MSTNNEFIKNYFERTLIIAPHMDDETIGCGGLINILKRNNLSVNVVIVATSNSFSYNANRIVHNDERMVEFKNAMKVLGVREDELFQLQGSPEPYIDGQLDRVPLKQLVTQLDQIITSYKPTCVLIPCNSHHQDHKIVHEAGIAALRPTVYTNFIRLKAMYEYTYMQCWNSSVLPSGRMYINLDKDAVDAKVQALGEYKSQVQRDKRDLLDLSAIVDLSRIRGREIGHYNAELYYPMSIVF